MKEHIDRDDAVDRLLRTTLSSGGRLGVPSNDQCLDAETVAAWAEGRLPPSLASSAEAHAADCERCQALLAAFARTAPHATPNKPFFERWHFRWLVPVTAAAAALILYVVVPKRSAVEEAERMARQQYSEPAPSAPQSPLAASEPVAESARETLAKRDDASRSNEAEKRVDRFEQDAAAGRRDAGGDIERQQGQAANQQKPDEKPASQPLSRSADQARERSAGLADAADARLKQEPAAPAPLEARGVAMAETIGAARAASAGMPAQEIVSSDPAYRWRIGQSGSVQRSTDGGASWETLATGVNVPMRAGSAPGPSTVWLVGRAGTVLLTTDGRQWRQVTMPAPVDLVAVQAADARTATVTAADGRVFRTSDGGQTWVR